MFCRADADMDRDSDALPMVFMLLSTFAAMISNLGDFWSQRGEGGGVLFAIGLVLLVLAIWLSVEAIFALKRFWGAPKLQSMEIEFE